MSFNILLKLLDLCRPSVCPKCFFIIFGALCWQDGLKWGRVSFGATCMGRMAKNTPPPRHGGGWDGIGYKRMTVNEIGSSGTDEERAFQKGLDFGSWGKGGKGWQKRKKRKQRRGVPKGVEAQVSFLQPTGSFFFLFSHGYIIFCAYEDSILVSE